MLTPRQGIDGDNGLMPEILQATASNTLMSALCVNVLRFFGTVGSVLVFKYWLLSDVVWAKV